MLTIEPIGNSEKSEPQMGFEHLGSDFSKFRMGLIANILFNMCTSFSHLLI